MNNIIPKLGFFVLLFCGMISGAYSQMTPAKMLPPKVKREITIKASEKTVWDLLASLEKVEEYVPSLVKKSVADGHGRDAVREMEMVDGTTRLETVLIFAPDSKRICFIPFEDYLPTTQLAVHYVITPQGPNKCLLTISGYFEAEKGVSKAKIIKQLGEEFSQTLEGLKAYFE